MGAPIKEVGRRTYISAQHVGELTGETAALVSDATRLATTREEIEFNLLRINEHAGEVAFLDYPTLAEEPFPALLQSWRVHPSTSLVTYRDFRESLNPPILHRTELFLDEDHPRKRELGELTSSCEGIGLFDEPSKIGFKRQWEQLVASKGYQVVGFELVPLANQTEFESIHTSPTGDFAIARHLTALSRSTLSAPVQSLLRHGLLKPDLQFFDYGCGKGDDISALCSAGYQGSGWDPYFRPEGDKQRAHIVNIGFVINVIEDRDERIDALIGAYSLAEYVLAVAAMTTSQGRQPGQAFRDGVLTSKRTFQKYFTQAELQQFIETVLDEDAYPAGPGIFYVFKNRLIEQQYLMARSANRTRTSRLQVTPAPQRNIQVVGNVFEKKPRPIRKLSRKRERSPEQQQILKALWVNCLELGRIPEPDEISDADLVDQQFRSLGRAVTAALAEHGEDAFFRSQQGRKSDIAVMLALQFFSSRRRFSELDLRFRRDIRALYGSYVTAEEKARELLFSVNRTDLIRAKCAEASTLGLGWLEAEHTLQLHTSLIERLDPALRVYIGCACALAGDIDSFDLVKIHIDSGKVTLMKYDDFIEKPLPALLKRVKARLRDQELDVFEYGEQFPPTVLYFKSRYINEEFPHYAEQLAFDENLEMIGALDLSGLGDSKEAVTSALMAKRWEIAGFQLVRSQNMPQLDDKCGQVFTYRQLIECGETWNRVRVGNTPEQADSFTALYELCANLLDPIVDYFGAIVLTYGFSSPPLSREIRERIEPKIDQHAACEHKRNGDLICSRLGAAVDFLVEDENMREVAAWIATNLPFDRLYFYGSDRPIHISYGPDNSRESFELVEHSGRRVPRRINLINRESMSRT
jgi:DNA phosphorothioation-associated putative methyltransferase